MREIIAALRQFRKSPSFCITIVLTLALGIGANAAIFTLVHAVLLRSLPIMSPGTLYRVGDGHGEEGEADGFPDTENTGDFSMFSAELYRHIAETTPQFSQLAAMESTDERMSVRRGGHTGRSERTEFVSGNYFQTLGIGPFAGRVLDAADDQPRAAPVAVMSYAAWQADFGGDPSIVGQTLSFQGHPLTVAGVSPPGFFGDRVDPDPPAFWVPLSAEPLLHGNLSVLHIKEANWLYLLGRPRPGVDPRAVSSEITTNLRQWLRTVPAYTDATDAPLIARQHVMLTAGGEGIQNLQDRERRGLTLLMAICGMVLFVSCANVANLLLARGATQRADLSLRMALGATRPMLVRQTLVESVLLASAGGVAGIAIAYAGARLILALAFPGATQLPIRPQPSLAVLGFAFMLSVLTGVLFGIAPAWMTSHADPAEALRSTNRSTRDRASLPQRWLIVFQSALSLVLLVGAGLLTHSLANLEDQNLQIQTRDRYVVHIDPAGAGYTAANAPALDRELEQRFGNLPGVASVGLALYSPLEQDAWMKGVYIEGQSNSAGKEKEALYDRVSSQFFQSIGQPLLRGRDFSDSDTQSSQGVAIINEAFAKRYFPGEDPVGHYFGTEAPRFANAFRVVGVIADTKYINPAYPAMPMVFRPITQEVSGLTEPSEKTGQERSMMMGAIVLQFKGETPNVEAVVRQTLAGINPNLSVINLRRFRDQVAGNFTEDRLLSRLSILFGVLALLLAGVGIYGVSAYQVSRRVNEIGVRMALGATRNHVLQMVMREALMRVGLGLAVGIPLALVGSRLIAHQLYGVSSYDPVTLLLATLALLLCAIAAAALPAQRAATIEPIVALRSE
ncbi:MAG: ABC transporter permease [Acidobacteriaceae bacterium]